MKNFRLKPEMAKIFVGLLTPIHFWHHSTHISSPKQVCIPCLHKIVLSHLAIGESLLNIHFITYTV